MDNQEYQGTARAPTLGARRVRSAFNPSADSLVDIAKQKSADLIDFVDAHAHMDPRLAELAMTHLEIAAMFAVKLVTTPKEEQAARQSPGVGQIRQDNYANERRDNGPEKGG